VKEVNARGGWHVNTAMLGMLISGVILSPKFVVIFSPDEFFVLWP
jgi:hypothetical protein